MREGILPVAGMEKLLKKAGATRVSQDAKEAMRDVLEEHAMTLGAKAIKFAQHSGRKTVKSSDVKLASKE